MERLNLKAIPVAYDRNVYHLNKKELNIIKKTAKSDYNHGLKEKRYIKKFKHNSRRRHDVTATPILVL